ATISNCTKPTYFLYDVDDHTGVASIFCRRTSYESGNKPLETPEFSLGDLICARGIVIYFNRNMCLNAFKKEKVKSLDGETEAICHTLYTRGLFSIHRTITPLLHLETLLLERIYKNPMQKISARSLPKDRELSQLALQVNSTDPPEFTLSSVLKNLEDYGQISICQDPALIGIPVSREESSN
ncbi:hypothetical protein HMI54_006151, partial [Coelomomyces lativittatus]